MQHHRCSLPFSHVHGRGIRPDRPAAWLGAAAASQTPLPLALARDLGLMIALPLSRVRIQRPEYLPFDQDTTSYIEFLHRIIRHRLIRDISRWRPPVSDAVISVVLARLVKDVELPDIYRVPGGPAGALFIRSLAAELEHADPARIWQGTPAQDRPDWQRIFTPEICAKIESNLYAMDREELRFMVCYGPPLPGSPDPRDLLDLIALSGLPLEARLALMQTLKLLPHAGAAQTTGGIQTYPEGGYEGLARKGSTDSLLLTELAYPEAVFLHRVFNHEALYYGRERPRKRRREMAYLVGQLGWGLGGDGQVMVRAILLALAQAMRRRGYEVRCSFAGKELSRPEPLEKPGQVARVLYRTEAARAHEARVLKGVLKQLRAWRAEYPGRQVLWVLSEFFDADGADAHRDLYRALRAEAGSQAWFVHIGSQESRRTPPSARYFDTWQIIDTARLWGA